MPTSSPGASPRVYTVPETHRCGALYEAPRRRDGRPLALHLRRNLLVLAGWTARAWGSVVGQPPLRGSLVAVVPTGGLPRLYALRAEGAGRRRERAGLRLRGLGGAGLWLCGTISAWALFNLLGILVQTSWSGPPPAPPNPLEELGGRAWAWVPLALLGPALVSLPKEIFSRGFVQRALERRLGAVAGIVLSAVRFQAFYREPWRLGHLLAGGIVFGAFVDAARSLWAAVGPHLRGNGSLALLHAWGGDSLGSTDVGLSPRGENLLFTGSLALLILLHSRVRESARRGAIPVRFHGSVLRARLSPLRS